MAYVTLICPCDCHYTHVGTYRVHEGVRLPSDTLKEHLVIASDSFSGFRRFLEHRIEFLLETRDREACAPKRESKAPETRRVLALRVLDEHPH